RQSDGERISGVLGGLNLERELGNEARCLWRRAPQGLTVSALSFRMECQNPGVIRDSLDPQRVGARCEGLPGYPEFAGAFDASRLVHAHSPHAADRKLGNAVRSKRRLAVIDRDFFTFDCYFGCA